METLFISRDARLQQRENTLSILIDGKNFYYPIEKIRHLVLLGETRLNSKLLTLCGKHGVRVSIFDYYGYFKGCYEPINKNPSGKVKLIQASHILDPNKRMFLARQIIEGAAHNIKANLLYYQYRGHTTLHLATEAIERLAAKISKAQDSEQLMGIEGAIRQWYYSSWKLIDPALDFGERVRRPPNNPINCLISFLNQMVYTVVRHETSKTHLEESFSFLHSTNATRNNLSLDLSEPFKPVLSDMLIFRMVRKNILQESWFEQKEGVCLLTESGRRHISEQFSQRLEERYQGHSFRNWIYREALNIERHLLDVEEYQAFKRRV